MSSVAVNDGVVSPIVPSPWQQWTSRLQAYTDWLNAQLKRQDSSRSITDLRHDLQDGVVVAQLIEALGGEKVAGIDPRPTSPAGRKENVERIFQHFSAKQVPISYCRAKDVLAGDLKCIMRLIHAVASHYRPESVFQPAHNAAPLPVGHRSRCAATPAAGGEKAMTSSLSRQKSDVLSSARKASGSSALPIRRQPLSSRDIPKFAATPSSLSLDRKRSPLRKSFTSLACERLSRASGDKSSGCCNVPKKERISCKVAPLQLADEITPSVHTSSRLSRRKSMVSRSQPCSLDSVDNKTLLERVKPEKKPCSCANLLSNDVEELYAYVKDTKEQLLLLQELLLHSNGGKFLEESDHVPYGSESAITPRMLLKESSSKDTLSSSKCGHVTEPLSMVKKLISYMSVCTGRKTDEQTSMSKQPAPETTEVAFQNIKEENENLRKTIEERDQEIKKLKIALNSQITSLEKKSKYMFPVNVRTQREELQVVHEALTSLRKCFPANNPYQHTLDTIEQSLSALLERVNSLEIGAVPLQQSPTVPENIPAPVIQATYLPPNNTPIQRAVPKISGSNLQRHEDSRGITKVVYYMDKSLTPFRCVLNKRIGEATLRDFKLLFDRPGQYRYHFKTLDPEFGMVKEEVLHDEDILPGWDGKIIAWIEEDCN